jgi:hypothetical protein
VARELRYADPLDLVWLATAERLGFAVQRSEAVFAAYDGTGVMTLGAPASLDPDDSLAQLILHELCHSLVEGEAARARPDWGLDNVSEADLVREHACHRLQAALSDRYGLRVLFGVTTDFRPYWDALPADPLADGPDPAIGPARAGFRRATEGPWAAALDDALRATRAIAEATRPFAAGDTLWARSG